MTSQQDVMGEKRWSYLTTGAGIMAIDGLLWGVGNIVFIDIFGQGRPSPYGRQRSFCRDNACMPKKY
jgi:hypothetical protein